MFQNHFTLSQVQNSTVNSTLDCQYLTLLSLYMITRCNLIVCKQYILNFPYLNVLFVSSNSVLSSSFRPYSTTYIVNVP